MMFMMGKRTIEGLERERDCQEEGIGHETYDGYLYNLTQTFI